MVKLLLTDLRDRYIRNPSVQYVFLRSCRGSEIAGDAGPVEVFRSSGLKQQALIRIRPGRNDETLKESPAALQRSLTTCVEQCPVSGSEGT